jgi:hypothetical protein
MYALDIYLLFWILQATGQYRNTKTRHHLSTAINIWTSSNSSLVNITFYLYYYHLCMEYRLSVLTPEFDGSLYLNILLLYIVHHTIACVWNTGIRINTCTNNSWYLYVLLLSYIYIISYIVNSTNTCVRNTVYPY